MAKYEKWMDNFIKYDRSNGQYIAYDETQAHELGRFPTFTAAVMALESRAKELEGTFK